jgi:glutamine synthetase
MSVADPQECIDFLAAHPQVKYVDVFFTSMTGVPRGKRLRVHELQAIYDYGRFLPGSILVVDTQGADCEDTGLVWEDGDADRRARPVPGTLTLAPWLGPDMAQVMLSLYELDGTPNDLDPRHVLARVLDRFAADGLTPVAACELEYYLVDQHRGPGGELLPARSLQTGERPQGIQVYGLPELEAISPLLRELWDTCDVLGVPLEGAISEFAPGQVELTLKHKPDALEAADDALRYKRAAKGVALRHGCEATFMAKPWADQAGNGFHVHVSFNDAEGKNLCAAEDPEGSDLLRHAIGGMKALQGQQLRAGGPDLGRQQPHGVLARAGRPAADPARRAPRGRGRRQSVPGAGRSAGLRPPRDHPPDRSGPGGGRRRLRGRGQGEDPPADGLVRFGKYVRGVRRAARLSGRAVRGDVRLGQAHRTGALRRGGHGAGL